MSARHTPGPWEATPGGSSIRTTMAGLEGGVLVADLYCRGMTPWDHETRQANAALIAAAPAMLEALQDVEWGGLEDHPLGGYFGACPYCGGGDPDNPNTPREHAGHDAECKLAQAIRAATGGES
jgi:hypothetical protein